MNSSSVNTKVSAELRNSYCKKGTGTEKTEIFYSFYNRVFLLHSTDEPQHSVNVNSINVLQRVGNPK